MRVVFAGGKNIGMECLRYLMGKVNVVGVIPCDGIMAANKIQQMAPDMIVVVYYDRILKKDIIDIPPMGCINLHMALAEEYRGCYPTTWAIINGETKTGVTLHYIDEGIDTGDIIAQKVVKIEPDDTGKSLYNKCTMAGVELFKETFPLLMNGTAPRRKQVTTRNTKYYGRCFPSHNVGNYIRALTFPPFPEPYFYIGDKKMVIKEEFAKFAEVIQREHTWDKRMIMLQEGLQ